MNLWSGYVSKILLKELHTPTGVVRKVDDHFHPRKQTAAILLRFDWNSCVIPIETMNEFIEKYGAVHYVTQTENAKLKKFQKLDVENSYKNAGIELVQIDKADWKLISKKNKPTIEKYLV